VKHVDDAAAFQTVNDVGETSGNDERSRDAGCPPCPPHVEDDGDEGNGGDRDDVRGDGGEQSEGRSFVVAEL